MVGGHSMGPGQQLVGSPTDDLVDWNSGVSVRPPVRSSVRPQKVFRFPF